MRRDDSSIEAYLASVTGEQSEVLEVIRAVVREVAPEIEETIEYGMLGYPGLANLGAQKHHVSLYVMPSVLARHRQAFAGLSCGKSCLRFTGLGQVDRQRLRGLLLDVLEERRKPGGGS